MEPDETPEECIRREIVEELQVKTATVVRFRDYTMDGARFRVFVVTLDGAPNPNAGDFESWAWLTRSDVEDRDFALNCRERLLDYFDSRSQRRGEVGPGD